MDAKHTNPISGWMVCHDHLKLNVTLILNKYSALHSIRTGLQKCFPYRVKSLGCYLKHHHHASSASCLLLNQMVHLAFTASSEAKTAARFPVLWAARTATGAALALCTDIPLSSN